jgi:hypothetical protein
VPAGSDTLYNFLTQIAAFLEMECVHLLGLLRQRMLRDFTAVLWHEVLDAHCLGILFRRRYRARGLDGCRRLLLVPGWAVNSNPVRARGRNCRHHELAILNMREAMMRRLHSAPCRYVRRSGPLQTERKGLIGHVLEGHIVGNDVVVQMLVDHAAGFGRRVEQEVIRKAQDVSVGKNTSLGIEEEGVDPISGFHLLHMIGGHRVQEARPIFAGDPNSSAIREIEQRSAARERVVSCRRIVSHLSPLWL